jgi:CubicO group peptidase (beta-lactamase class C family)
MPGVVSRTPQRREPSGSEQQRVAPPFQVGPQPRFDSFAQEIDRLRQLLEIPGLSAAIVEKGQIVWSRAYGIREKLRKLPATTDTIFPIASLTKTFTAVLVMQMVEQGKLSLDDPVSKFRSDTDVQPATRVRHYLSHTSEGVPGSRFSYNGERYARLAPILEKISGKSFRALVSENILDKLRMDQSVPGLDAARDDGPRYEPRLLTLARPHDLRSGQIEQLVFPPEQLDGASGIISSVLDLAKYVAAIRSNSLISAESKALMFTAFLSANGRKLPYGLGWFVQNFHGHKLVWHYGQEAGFSSLLLMAPDRDLALILEANSGALSEPFWLLFGDVLRSPFALAFLRRFVLNSGGVAPDWTLAPSALSAELSRRDGQGFDFADDLLDRALASAWLGDASRAVELFQLALQRYPRLRSSAGHTLLSVLARSGDAALAKEGEQIGRALLATSPSDPRTLFDLGVLLLHMHRAVEAVPLFARIGDKPHDTNRALLAWSAYLLAENIADSDPDRARGCLKTVIATQFEDGNLQQDAKKLLEKLSAH